MITGVSAAEAIDRHRFPLWQGLLRNKHEVFIFTMEECKAFVKSLGYIWVERPYDNGMGVYTCRLPPDELLHAILLLRVLIRAGLTIRDVQNRCGLVGGGQWRALEGFGNELLIDRLVTSPKVVLRLIAVFDEERAAGRVKDSAWTAMAKEYLSLQQEGHYFDRDFLARRWFGNEDGKLPKPVKISLLEFAE